MTSQYPDSHQKGRLVHFCLYVSLFVATLTPLASAAAHNRLRATPPPNVWKTCSTRTEFIKTCHDVLISDPDSDKIVSQEEYAYFVKNASSYISSKVSLSRVQRESSVATTSLFNGLPINLQIRFVRFVCAQWNDDKSSTSESDCMADMSHNGLNRDTFGMVLGEDPETHSADEGIYSLCVAVFPDVVRAGYLEECSETATAFSKA